SVHREWLVRLCDQPARVRVATEAVRTNRTSPRAQRSHPTIKRESLTQAVRQAVPRARAERTFRDRPYPARSTAVGRYTAGACTARAGSARPRDAAALPGARRPAPAGRRRAGPARRRAVLDAAPLHLR